MNDFASRLSRVRPSAIRTLNERARELNAMGRDIIDLSIGEPDFETPENVKQAAIDAIRRGETRYTEIHGSWELRDANGAKFKRDHGLDFSRDQITVARGRAPRRLALGAAGRFVYSGAESPVPGEAVQGYWSGLG